MKRVRLLLLTGFSLTVLSPLRADGSFSVGIGGNFFLNETTYLDAFSVAYEHELQEGLELNLGADLGINRENENEEGEKVAGFLVPATVGLNFVFSNDPPNDPATFVLGAGISPIMNFNPETDEEFTLFGGPYIKAMVRVKVHQVANWFLSAQQDLQLGGDDIINASTRILTGLNFTIDDDGPTD